MKEHVVKGEGMTFYSPEEVIIALQRKCCRSSRKIKVKVKGKEDE